MTRTRSLLAAALIALCVIGSATPAAAHAGIVSTDPDKRSSLPALPEQVSMTFNEEMNRPSYVTVTAPDGSLIAEGESEVRGPVLVQPLTDDPGLAGTYRVDYRAVSADGHPVEGAFEFEVTGGEKVAQGTVEKVTSSKTWWIALVTVPWIALAAILVWRRMRRPDPSA
ncbi:MAG: copper resistance protein CopC [Aeromicrobium sp.]|uniref:copper resistance CopC family protein n=1 Tax=Aeromicrobium sp. TaxID=1871063 RepID=UPI0039E4C53A